MNEVGFETANPDMVAGRDLPWLQDTPEVDVWTTWNVTYRDVIALGVDGEHLFTFNVTDRDLNDEAEYAALADLLRDAAEGAP